MSRITRFAFLIALVLFPSLLSAQNVASMTGLVTDMSGAVIPKAEITLVNGNTGTSYQATSNASGAYSFTNVPPGPGYKVTFSAQGFEPFTVSEIYLTVNTTRTQNVSLHAGAESVTLEVSAASSEVTINTNDASVGNNFDVKLLNELPVQNRDSPAALFTLQPGVTLDGAVTGARVDQNNVTVDGLDANDFATGTAFTVVGRAPVDAVQEFRGTVAGNTARSGPGGGGQYALVTKGGTNEFHGLLYEYHRDTATAANDWFLNNTGVGRAPLVRNQFGGNFNGPIIKNKLFFFFDYNNSRIVQSTPINRTVPLDSLRGGNVSYILDGCAATSRQNTTPGCIGTLSPAQVTQLDPQHIGLNSSVLALMNNRFPRANDLTGGDGVNTGSYRFNAPYPDFMTNYVTKIDYNLTDKMSVWGRFNITRENATQFAVQFPGDPVTAPYIDRSYSYVVGLNWAISSNKANQFYYGQTVQKVSFPNTYNPQGINPLTFTNGLGTFLSDAYRSPSNAQGRRVPIPVIGDDFTWQKGNHNLQFGGTFKFIKANSFTLLDYNTATIGLGGNTQGLDASLRPADIRTAGTTASNTYDNAFTFALGHIGSIDSNYNYDAAGGVLPQGSGNTRVYRYFQTQLYFGDTWKVTPHLTLSYGLNYQIFSVPYETRGLESFQPLTFDQYFSARVAQSAAGRSGNDAVPLLSYVLGGKANHGPDLYKPSYKDFAPRFAFAWNPSFDSKTVFNGGAGIVYDRTIINAVQYQQDQSSYLFQQEFVTTYGTAGDPTGSLQADPRLGANNSVPSLTPPAAPTTPFQPFVDGGIPFGLENGQSFNTSIDPTLKTPYSISYNFGVQHEFPNGFIFKLSYVGRLGRRLLAQADANQIIDFVDPGSQQTLSAAFSNIVLQHRAGVSATSVRPQAWFENQVGPGATAFLYGSSLGSLIDNGDFADFIQALAANELIAPNVGMGSQFSENTYYTNKGFSTYHGLLTTLQKNFSQGLQFDVNYTWAHSMDNVSLIANQGAAGGYGFVCDALRPRLCRGNSDFDVTHYISGDFTYQLPFGRGRMFGSKLPVALNEVLGGWDVSGITRWHTGQAYTTYSSAFVAGYANDAPAIFNGDKSAIRTRVHKTESGQVNLFDDPDRAQAAFSGPVGFDIGPRNILRGPGFFNQDFGVAKSFPLGSDKVNLKFRADAFNALNHPNFALPARTSPSSNFDITSGSFGRLTSIDTTGTGSVGGVGGYRVLQFALRLEF